MSFLNFDNDYGSMVQIFERSQFAQDVYFLQWLKQNRTKITLQVTEENSYPITDRFEIAHVKGRRARFQKMKELENGTLLRFSPSRKIMQELYDIRYFFARLWIMITAIAPIVIYRRLKHCCDARRLNY